MNVVTIARIAASNARKPNRSEAFRAVSNLIASLPDDADNHLVGELAELYKFFLPKVSKRPKTEFEWVTQAVATKDERRALLYTYVNEKHIVGTDGARLHVAPNRNGLESGFYDVAGNRVHEPNWANFPRYENAIPEHSIIAAMNIDLSTLPRQLLKDGKTDYIELPSTGAKLNRQNVDDATALDPGSLIISSPDDRGAVKFHLRDGRIAVIMPFNPDKV